MATKEFVVAGGKSGNKLEVTYQAATGADTVTDLATGMATIHVLVNDTASKLELQNALKAVLEKLYEVNVA